MITAPLEWSFALFPLAAEGDEILSIDRVAEIGCSLVSEAVESRDRARCGQVFHWAHILKSIQEPAGDWPATVNARTGKAIGADRTLAPIELMRMLDDLNDSSEYSTCIAFAEGRDPFATSPQQGEHHAR